MACSTIWYEVRIERTLHGHATLLNFDSWYHSHFALQAWEGVFGPILIHGPATANYEVDLGHLMMNDWSHQTADELYTSAETSGPPTLDTGLLNGLNVLPDDDSIGSRYNVSVQSGSTNRLRLVNAAIDTHFDFMVDNHTLQVVAMDFVPIKPYTTKTLSIGMGQRYDVIITADQSSVASDFWIRAIPDTYCSENGNSADIRGILHYDNSTSTPETSAWSYSETSCAGEEAADLVPYLSLDASSTFTSRNESNVTVAYNDDNVYKWYLNDESFIMKWGSPTALSIKGGADAASFDSEAAIVSLPDADEWFVLVIQADLAVPHPIHLHGHDFFVLGSGSGLYNSSVALNYANPPRRDVTMLPGDGYLVISIKTDNPGIWLCHCHIGWHTEEGFALQLIERNRTPNHYAYGFELISIQVLMRLLSCTQILRLRIPAKLGIRGNLTTLWFRMIPVYSSREGDFGFGVFVGAFIMTDRQDFRKCPVMLLHLIGLDLLPDPIHATSVLMVSLSDQECLPCACPLGKCLSN